MSGLRTIGEIAELAGELRRQVEEHYEAGDTESTRSDWLDRAANYLSAAESALDEAEDSDD